MKYAFNTEIFEEKFRKEIFEGYEDFTKAQLLGFYRLTCCIARSHMYPFLDNFVNATKLNDYIDNLNDGERDLICYVFGISDKLKVIIKVDYYEMDYTKENVQLHIIDILETLLIKNEKLQIFNFPKSFSCICQTSIQKLNLGNRAKNVLSRKKLNTIGRIMYYFNSNTTFNSLKRKYSFNHMGINTYNEIMNAISQYMVSYDYDERANYIKKTLLQLSLSLELLKSQNITSIDELEEYIIDSNNETLIKELDYVLRFFKQHHNLT